MSQLSPGHRADSAPKPQEAFRSAIFYSTQRNWGWGAPDYVWPAAAEQVLRAGINVTVITQQELLQRPEIIELRRQGACCLAQPKIHLGAGNINRWRRRLAQWSPSGQQLRRILRSAPRPYIFVNQSGSYDILHEPVLGPHLLHAHPAYDLFFRSNQYRPPLSIDERRRAIRYLDGARRCLFNSQWTHQLTEKQLLHQLGNASTFPHVVRFDYSTPLPWPEDHTLRLASVSRYDTHHKGLDVLLEGLALLSPSLPAWSCEFYGAGEEIDYLQGLARWLGLDQRVSFHSFVADVRDIWRRCHVLVLASRYEGLAVSMLEAMACGRPVVRTPYGGCAEWVRPGKTGFVCSAAEPSLIASTLTEVLRCRDNLPDMGRRAHQWLQTHLPLHPENVYLSPFGLAEYRPVQITPDENA